MLNNLWKPMVWHSCRCNISIINIFNKFFHTSQAKIACSDICKCIGCKNCVDPVSSPGSAEKKAIKASTLASTASGSLLTSAAGGSLDAGGTGNRSSATSSFQNAVKLEDGTKQSDTPKGFAPLTSSGTRFLSLHSI